MTTQKTLLTAEDLYEMRMPEGRSELIDGVLVEMGPEAGESGQIAAEVAFRLMQYTKPLALGRIVTGNVGFILRHRPDHMRAPDVALVSPARLIDGRLPRRFIEGSPDLVVEVVSPSDRASEVQAKALEWLAGGAKLVWVLFPDTRTVMVYQPEHEVLLLTEEDTLTGEPVLPGFSAPVRELFA